VSFSPTTSATSGAVRICIALANHRLNNCDIFLSVALTSGVEIGSGSMMQSLPQIVAGTLGIRPEDVIVRQADTNAAGYDVGVAAAVRPFRSARRA
jgi:CO/xanthine dehydrogenase Mo-binding subunit